MGETLQQTPTWAIAIVCAVFVTLSLLVERTIFYVGKWLQAHNNSSLYEALEKIKEELMLLGFVSLFLTMAQREIAKICIPEKASRIMLPCGIETSEVFASNEENTCIVEGTVPFVPLEGLHQLHILIFIMAVSHVLYSVVTMTLGRWKVIRWKKWEEETKTEEYQSIHGTGYKHAAQNNFIKKHTTSVWNRHPILQYIAAFFLQFCGSVTRIDYLTLRHGFIMNHMDRNVQFNFHKYILRSLEDDFKHVVGISPMLWMFLILFLLLNVYGWKTYLWISVIPLLMVLAVGAKLRQIITKLAFEITERHTVIEGIPIVKPRNELFWFGKPEYLLYLIHFILFQNAFDLSYYSWALATFGPDSCFHEDRAMLFLRFTLGFLVQIICSYVTLPLYALVTQMGSHLKKSIFDDHVRDALDKWKRRAKMLGKKRLRARGNDKGQHDVCPHNVLEQDNSTGENLETVNGCCDNLKICDKFEEPASFPSPNADDEDLAKDQLGTLHRIISRVNNSFKNHSFKNHEYNDLCLEIDQYERI